MERKQPAVSGKSVVVVAHGQVLSRRFQLHRQSPTVRFVAPAGHRLMSDIASFFRHMGKLPRFDHYQAGQYLEDYWLASIQIDSDIELPEGAQLVTLAPGQDMRLSELLETLDATSASVIDLHICRDDSECSPAYWLPCTDADRCIAYGDKDIPEAQANYEKYVSDYLEQIVGFSAAYSDLASNDTGKADQASSFRTFLKNATVLQSYTEGVSQRFAEEIAIGHETGYFEPDLVDRLNGFRQSIERYIDRDVRLPIQDEEVPVATAPGRDPASNAQSVIRSIEQAEQYYQQLSGEQREALQSETRFGESAVEKFASWKQTLQEHPEQYSELATKAFGFFNELDTYAESQPPSDDAVAAGGWWKALTPELEIQRLERPGFQIELRGEPIDANADALSVRPGAFEHLYATNVDGLYLGYNGEPSEVQASLKAINRGLNSASNSDYQSFAKQLFISAKSALNHAAQLSDGYQTGDDARGFIFGVADRDTELGPVAGTFNEDGEGTVPIVTVPKDNYRSAQVIATYEALSSVVGQTAYFEGGGESPSYGLTLPNGLTLEWGPDVERARFTGTTFFQDNAFQFGETQDAGWISANGYRRANGLGQIFSTEDPNLALPKSTYISSRALTESTLDFPEGAGRITSFSDAADILNDANYTIKVVKNASTLFRNLTVSKNYETPLKDFLNQERRFLSKNSEKIADALALVDYPSLVDPRQPSPTPEYAARQVLSDIELGGATLRFETGGDTEFFQRAIATAKNVYESQIPGFSDALTQLVKTHNRGTRDAGSTRIGGIKNAGAGFDVDTVLAETRALNQLHRGLGVSLYKPKYPTADDYVAAIKEFLTQDKTGISAGTGKGKLTFSGERSLAATANTVVDEIIDGGGSLDHLAKAYLTLKDDPAVIGKEGALESLSGLGDRLSLLADTQSIDGNLVNLDDGLRSRLSTGSLESLSANIPEIDSVSYSSDGHVRYLDASNEVLPSYKAPVFDTLDASDYYEHFRLTNGEELFIRQLDSKGLAELITPEPAQSSDDAVPDDEAREPEKVRVFKVKPELYKKLHALVSEERVSAEDLAFSYKYYRAIVNEGTEALGYDGLGQALGHKLAYYKSLGEEAANDPGYLELQRLTGGLISGFQAKGEDFKLHQLYEGLGDNYDAASHERFVSNARWLSSQSLEATDEIVHQSFAIARDKAAEANHFLLFGAQGGVLEDLADGDSVSKDYFRFNSLLVQKLKKFSDASEARTLTVPEQRTYQSLLKEVGTYVHDSELTEHQPKVILTFFDQLTKALRGKDDAVASIKSSLSYTEEQAAELTIAAKQVQGSGDALENEFGQTDESTKPLFSAFVNDLAVGDTDTKYVLNKNLSKAFTRSTRLYGSAFDYDQVLQAYQSNFVTGLESGPFDNDPANPEPSGDAASDPDEGIGDDDDTPSTATNESQPSGTGESSTADAGQPTTTGSDPASNSDRPVVVNVGEMRFPRVINRLTPERYAKILADSTERQLGRFAAADADATPFVLGLMKYLVGVGIEDKSGIPRETAKGGQELFIREFLKQPGIASAIEQATDIGGHPLKIAQTIRDRFGQLRQVYEDQDNTIVIADLEFHGFDQSQLTGGSVTYKNENRQALDGVPLLSGKGELEGYEQLHLANGDLLLYPQSADNPPYLVKANLLQRIGWLESDQTAIGSEAEVQDAFRYQLVLHQADPSGRPLSVFEHQVVNKLKAISQSIPFDPKNASYEGLKNPVYKELVSQLANFAIELRTSNPEEHAALESIISSANNGHPEVFFGQAAAADPQVKYRLIQAFGEFDPNLHIQQEAYQTFNSVLGLSDSSDPGALGLASDYKNSLQQVFRSQGGERAASPSEARNVASATLGALSKLSEVDGADASALLEAFNGYIEGLNPDDVPKRLGVLRLVSGLDTLDGHNISIDEGTRAKLRATLGPADSIGRKITGVSTSDGSAGFSVEGVVGNVYDLPLLGTQEDRPGFTRYQLRDGSVAYLNDAEPSDSYTLSADFVSEIGWLENPNGVATDGQQVRDSIDYYQTRAYQRGGDAITEFNDLLINKVNTAKGQRGYSDLLEGVLDYQDYLRSHNPEAAALFEQQLEQQTSGGLEVFLSTTAEEHPDLIPKIATVFSDVNTVETVQSAALSAFGKALNPQEDYERISGPNDAKAYEDILRAKLLTVSSATDETVPVRGAASKLATALDQTLQVLGKGKGDATPLFQGLTEFFRGEGQPLAEQLGTVAKFLPEATAIGSVPVSASNDARQNLFDAIAIETRDIPGSEIRGVGTSSDGTLYFQLDPEKSLKVSDLPVFTSDHTPDGYIKLSQDELQRPGEDKTIAKVVYVATGEGHPSFTVDRPALDKLNWLHSTSTDADTQTINTSFVFELAQARRDGSVAAQQRFADAVAGKLAQLAKTGGDGAEALGHLASLTNTTLDQPLAASPLERTRLVNAIESAFASQGDTDVAVKYFSGVIVEGGTNALRAGVDRLRRVEGEALSRIHALVHDEEFARNSPATQAELLKFDNQRQLLLAQADEEHVPELKENIRILTETSSNLRHIQSEVAGYAHALTGESLDTLIFQPPEQLLQKIDDSLPQSGATISDEGVKKITDVAEGTHRLSALSDRQLLDTVASAEGKLPGDSFQAFKAAVTNGDRDIPLSFVDHRAPDITVESQPLSGRRSVAPTEFKDYVLNLQSKGASDRALAVLHGQRLAAAFEKSVADLRSQYHLPDDFAPILSTIERQPDTYKITFKSESGPDRTVTSKDPALADLSTDDGKAALEKLRTANELGESYSADVTGVKKQPGLYDIDFIATKNDSQRLQRISTPDPTIADVAKYVGDGFTQLAPELTQGGKLKLSSDGGLGDFISRRTNTSNDEVDEHSVSTLNLAFGIQGFINYIRHKDANDKISDSALRNVLKAHEYVNLSRAVLGTTIDGGQLIGLVKALATASDAEFKGATNAVAAVGGVVGGGADLVLGLASTGFDIYELTKAKDAGEKAVLGTQLAFDVGGVGLSATSLGLGIAGLAGVTAASTVGTLVGGAGVIFAGLGIAVGALVSTFVTIEKDARKVGDMFYKIHEAYKKGGFTYDSGTLKPIDGAVINDINFRTGYLEYGSQTYDQESRNQVGGARYDNNDGKHTHDLLAGWGISRKRWFLDAGFDATGEPDTYGPAALSKVLVLPATPTGRIGNFDWNTDPGSTTNASKDHHYHGYDYIRQLPGLSHDFVADSIIEYILDYAQVYYGHTHTNVVLDRQDRVIAFPDIPDTYIGRLSYDIHGDGGNYTLSLNDHASFTIHDDKPSGWVVEYSNVSSHSLSVTHDHVKVGNASVRFENHDSKKVIINSPEGDVYQADFENARPLALFINGEGISKDHKSNNGKARTDLVKHLESLQSQNRLNELTVVNNYHADNGKVYAKIFYQKGEGSHEGHFLYAGDLEPSDQKRLTLVQAFDDGSALFFNNTTHQVVQVNADHHTVNSEFNLPGLGEGQSIEAVDSSRADNQTKSGILVRVAQTLPDKDNVHYNFVQVKGEYVLQSIEGDSDLYSALSDQPKLNPQQLSTRFKKPILISGWLSVTEDGKPPLFVRSTDGLVLKPGFDGAGAQTQLLSAEQTAPQVLSTSTVYLNDQVYFVDKPPYSVEQSQLDIDKISIDKAVGFNLSGISFSDSDGDLNNFLHGYGKPHEEGDRAHKNVVHHIRGRIYLAQGQHELIIHHDDGLRFILGGQTLVKVNSWDKDAPNRVSFQADHDGYYDLDALYYQDGGTSYLQPFIDDKPLTLNNFSGPQHDFTDNLLNNAEFAHYDEILSTSEKRKGEGWEISTGKFIRSLERFPNFGDDLRQAEKSGFLQQDLTLKRGAHYVVHLDKLPPFPTGKITVKLDYHVLGTIDLAKGTNQSATFEYVGESNGTHTLGIQGDFGRKLHPNEDEPYYRKLADYLIENPVQLYLGDKASFDATQAKKVPALLSEAATDELGQAAIFYDSTNQRLYSQSNAKGDSTAITLGHGDEIDQTVLRALPTDNGVLAFGQDGLSWQVDNTGKSELLAIGSVWVNQHKDWAQDLASLLADNAPVETGRKQQGLIAVGGLNQGFIQGEVIFSDHTLKGFDDANAVLNAGTPAKYEINALDFTEQAKDKSLAGFLDGGEHNAALLDATAIDGTKEHDKAVHKITGRIYLSEGAHSVDVIHDGLQLSLGGKQLISNTSHSGSKPEHATFTADHSGYYDLSALYYENSGSSALKVAIDKKVVDSASFSLPIEAFFDKAHQGLLLLPAADVTDKPQVLTYDDKTGTAVVFDEKRHSLTRHSLIGSEALVNTLEQAQKGNVPGALDITKLANVTEILPDVSIATAKTTDYGFNFVTESGLAIRADNAGGGLTVVAESADAGATLPEGVAPAPVTAVYEGELFQSAVSGWHFKDLSKTLTVNGLDKTANYSPLGHNSTGDTLFFTKDDLGKQTLYQAGPTRNAESLGDYQYVASLDDGKTILLSAGDNADIQNIPEVAGASNLVLSVGNGSDTIQLSGDTLNHYANIRIAGVQPEALPQVQLGDFGGFNHPIASQSGNDLVLLASSSEHTITFEGAFEDAKANARLTLPDGQTITYGRLAGLIDNEGGDQAYALDGLLNEARVPSIEVTPKKTPVDKNAKKVQSSSGSAQDLNKLVQSMAAFDGSSNAELDQNHRPDDEDGFGGINADPTQ